MACHAHAESHASVARDVKPALQLTHLGMFPACWLQDLQHVAASLAADVHALLAAVGGHRAQLQAATHTSKHAQ